MILKPPPGAQVHELTNSTMWLGEEGILYSLAKNHPQELTTGMISEEILNIRKIIGNEKVCMIAEMRKTGPLPIKEQRQMIAREISGIVKALALITTSPLSRMITNIFFSFVPPRYPMKMFNNLEDARIWISKFNTKS